MNMVEIKAIFVDKSNGRYSIIIPSKTRVPINIMCAYDIKIMGA